MVVHANQMSLGRGVPLDLERVYIRIYTRPQCVCNTLLPCSVLD